MAYGTSHIALVHRARLKAGQTVLVLGAAGGVGMAAVQIARALGAKVVAVARGAEKMKALKAAGADFCIDSDTLHEADGVGGGSKSGRGGALHSSPSPLALERLVPETTGSHPTSHLKDAAGANEKGTRVRPSVAAAGVLTRA